MRIKSKEILASFPSPGLCEYCKIPCASRERHHIFTRGSGGPDLRCNLIMLGDAFTDQCACHLKYHNGSIARDEFLAIVAMRERTTVEAIESLIYLVRRLKKSPSPEEVWAEIELLSDPIARRLCRDELIFVGVL